MADSSVSSPGFMEASSSVAASTDTSRIRRHKGNIPSLPQTKHCPLCTARFTRTTHLNRHLRSHTNERDHRCDRCQSQFTRSDLLTRHKRTCGDPLLANRSRRKSCEACAESKIKCDLEQPCSKCVSRDRECIYINDPKQSANRPSHSRIKKSKSPSPSQAPSHGSGGGLGELLLGSPMTTSEVLTSSEHSSPLSTASSLSSETSLDTTLHFPFGDLDTLSLPSQADFNKLFSATMFDAGIEYGTPPDIHSSRESYSFIDAYPLYSHDVPPPMYNAEGVVVAAGPTGNASNFDPVSLMPSNSTLPAVPASDAQNSSNSELQHYLYLFFEEFLSQIPIVHRASWSPEGKPPILLRAMRACGALFAKTDAAQQFVSETLRSSREMLISEFSHNSGNVVEQTYLMMAVTLLQTVGLFHQREDQRTSSSIYHGMVVMMIRRSGMIERNTTWSISDYSDPARLDEAWRNWATHEMIKRALLLSYLHDCCQSIYFSMSPSFLPGEVRLHLPCDDTLWRATTAQEWLSMLQLPSHPVPPMDRLLGHSFQITLANLGEMRAVPNAMISDRFSLFILIHAILCDMYSAGLRTPKESSSGTWSRGNHLDNPFALQSALHGWMQCWMNEPAAAIPEDNRGERFMFNPLPFYWLAQISLMTLQQGLPPLASDTTGRDVEVTFRLMKRWLWHIRSFLRKDDRQAPAGILWEDLMRIRLETCHMSPLAAGTIAEEDNHGLMGFFTEG
ncbi:hypothetical protein NEOLEDRAFT_1092876 [Neolentinus lepideus HHB14362 ss-1]|uniref:Zn(2)-C6 fungal-type domain-containing protein n=1 Tax=Neolentinus lepideus HHB14362 ss-1 TaxID=1314782 RepID=A0A165SNS4_9AGAM|nr:hypothetical protein NEOLEDRAFT_1092876 [Neolentinus lepideus HHB14362 ss-1]